MFGEIRKGKFEPQKVSSQKGVALASRAAGSIPGYSPERWKSQLVNPEEQVFAKSPGFSARSCVNYRADQRLRALRKCQLRPLFSFKSVRQPADVGSSGMCQLPRRFDRVVYLRKFQAAASL